MSELLCLKHAIESHIDDLRLTNPLYYEMYSTKFRNKLLECHSKNELLSMLKEINNIKDGITL